MHLVTVEVGQHHVEHDEVGAPAGNGSEGVAPGRRGLDLEPLVAQCGGDELDDAAFVVDHQDAGGGSGDAVMPDCRAAFLRDSWGVAARTGRH